MRRKYITSFAALLLVISLTACGNNQEGAGENEQGNQPIPIGYDSNEQHEKEGGNVSWLDEDNDGPVTEMMDHSLGGEGGKSKANNSTNVNWFDETIFSRNDRNYHGHLNDINGGARSSYYTAYEGKLAKRISQEAESVVNVGAARAIIHGDRVIVGTVLEDERREKETIAAIQDAVDPLLKGKKLVIDTSEGNYSRIRTIDNNLREGGPKQEMDREIEHLFQTIGNKEKQNR